MQTFHPFFLLHQTTLDMIYDMIYEMIQNIIYDIIYDNLFISSQLSQLGISYLRHPNISLRQLGAVCEDLPLKEKLMVMSHKSGLRQPQASLDFMTNMHTHVKQYNHIIKYIIIHIIYIILYYGIFNLYIYYNIFCDVIPDMIQDKIFDRMYDMV